MTPPRARPPNGLLPIGVIGGGVLAQTTHLPNLVSMPERFRLVALADPSPKVRHAVAARFDIPAVYATAVELLREERLAAVLVCSPNASHAGDVVAALRRGLHVLVEKPMCIAPRDAALIAAEQARADRVVQVGYMKRFDRAFERLLEVVADGGECDLVHVLTHEPPLAALPHLDGVTVADDLEDRRRRELEALRAAQVRAAVGVDDLESAFAFSEVFLGSVVHDLNLAARIVAAVDDRVEPSAAIGTSWAAGAAAQVIVPTIAGRRCVLTWIESAGYFDETITVLAPTRRHEVRFTRAFNEAPVTEFTSYAARKSRYGELYARANDPFKAELAHFHDCVIGGAACRTPASEGQRDVDTLTAAFAAGLPLS